MEGLKNYFKTYALLQSLTPEHTELSGTSKQKEHVIAALNNSKIFCISKEISELLLLTNNTIKLIPFPFPIIFLDIQIEIENFLFNGLLCCGANDNENGINFGDDSINRNNRAIISVVFNKTTNKYQNYFGVFFREKVMNLNAPLKQQVRISKKINLFITNFLDLLNNPEIEIALHKTDSERNEKRLSKGKLLIPDRRFVVVKGKIKQYIDQLKTGKHFSVSHRFWVRGHFRYYKSERFKQEVRNKTYWILPYVKGHGILIEKYRVVKS